MKLWADLWDLGEATDCFTMVLGRAAADRKCVVTAKRRVIALVTDCIWRANQNMQSGSHDGNWDYLAGSTPIQTKPQVLEDAQSSPLQDVTEDFPSKVVTVR
jgi:hypothetical protein